MPIFEYSVKIDAANGAEAKEILQSMFDIMKTIRKETNAQDFIEFGKKLRNNPSLVKKAKFFL